ncbi:MAG: hypothetical protein EZS26_002538 [Candidatus Ordinivivax streblomastigis]|uniref:DUF86 domain-containing protein n=1 Tax=Candidatus Ordinivivax streblomastigis TaxID=2540710 RepID=A0A5M8NYW8_9BACT|nr:MAG: hypothetical protein EZS26_002538 [Candidatus Ordinivivax streblomastigis]
MNNAGWRTIESASKYLFDISNFISLTEDFLVGIADFQAYQKDIKTQSAVERQLAIIGEVVNKLGQETTEITLTHARQIVDFRNRIIHSYDNMDASIVWVIVKK